MLRFAVMAGGRRLKLLAFVFLLILMSFVVPGAAADQPHVRLLDVDGAITPVMANYIAGGIRDAGRANANAVILQLNTPGGLSSAMDDIVQSILNSPVPVIVFVAPNGARAASAGVYITYVAHVAAMAPSTNIGSATPVALNASGQIQSLGDTETQKIVNDATAKLIGFADLRGRNKQWAEQAVRQAENVTATQAQSMHIIDYVATDIPNLLSQADGRNVAMANGRMVTLHTQDAVVQTEDMGLSEQLLQIISDPTIAYILLSLGMLGLFLELAHPGAILPGVIGGIAVLVGLFALGSLHANWAGVGLMGLGFVLFLIDVYVSSHGVLTVGGIVAFALGSFMLMNSDTTPALHISKIAIATVTALLALFGMFVVGAVARSRMRRAQTGREQMIGSIGTARERLDPDGYVYVAGELWRASSPAGPIEAGLPVRVINIDGLHLTVLPAEAAERPIAVAPGI